MATITDIADLRAVARRKIPRVIFDYVDGGSYEEVTLRRNVEDLRRLELRQRVMQAVGPRSLATTIAGQPATIPVALGPVGLTGLAHANGEIAAAKAAEAFGVPYCLSTVSICSIEQVAAEVKKPFWFQLYLMRDRGVNAALIDRAKQAGCPVLVLTVDLHVQGKRHKDAKNGLSIPPRATRKNVLDLLSHPGWLLSLARSQSRTFGNLQGLVKHRPNVRALSGWIGEQFDPSIGPKDVEWVRNLWPGKLILKGILDREDAEAAVKLGADGIVVSNHGGRQLDGAPSSISVLPQIAEAVGGATQVYFDGGVRTGMDVLKALALGARGCFLGRAYIYGLAAYGQQGVLKALDILRQELDVAMALTGMADVKEVTRETVLGSAPPLPSGRRRS